MLTLRRLTRVELGSEVEWGREFMLELHAKTIFAPESDPNLILLCAPDFDHQSIEFFEVCVGVPYLGQL